MRGWLQDDVERLTQRLLTVYAAPRFRLFFGAILGDQCRKFHVDYVHLRLLCTYLGPGTEWLRDEDVNRELLGAPFECPEQANEAVQRQPGRVRHLRLGEVAILKGEAYPGQPGFGLVHRSPPISQAGLARVFLSISLQDMPRGA